MNDLAKGMQKPISGSSVLAQISDPVIALDFKGRVLYWNSAAERLYGRTSEEMIGAASTGAFRLVSANGENEITFLEEIRQTGKAAVKTIQALHDGREIYVELQAYIYRDEEGREIGVVEVIRDASDRRAPQKASTGAESELRTRATLLDGASDAIFVTTLDGSITYWNKGAERLYGWSGTEALGKDEREILRAEYPVPYAELMSVLLRDEHWEGEVVRYRKSGEPLTVSSRWSLLKDAEGNPQARMVINTDLTEAKVAFEEMRRAEAEARARASELEAILSAMPGATFIGHGPDCSTMTSSRAAYELLRIPYGSNSSKSASAEERPTTFRVMKDGRELAAKELPVQQAAATGHPVFNAEVTLVFEDGTSRDIFGNAVPLLDDNGKPRGAVGSFIDVTERNAAIQDTRRKEAVLRAVIDNSSDFIFLKDPEGRYLVANPAAASAAEAVPADFLGKTDREVFSAEIAERHLKRDRQVMASGAAATFEDEIRFKGEPRHIQTLKNVCRDADGRIIGVLGITRDVTQQKLHEKMLAASEGRYRSLVEAIASTVWTASAEGMEIKEAAGWCAFTGQKAEEIAIAGGRSAIHPEDLERTVNAWRRSVASGETFEVEHRLRRHDGVYRIMLARAVPVRDVSGTIVEWVGIHTDITEQRMAEEASQQSEARFRKLFDSDLLGIGTPDRFGAFTDGNDELLRITGYTREDMEAGRVRWDTMTPPEYRELDAAHIAQAARRGSCTPYEKEYIRKDGSRVPILCGYALLEGSEDRYVGFVQDLTEQKAAEAGLREREKRFRLLADSLPLLMWISDAAGNNIFCNRGCLEYHGITPEAALGLSWQSWIHPEDQSSTAEKWSYSIRTGEPYQIEHRLRRADGTYRLFRAHGIPVRNEAGDIEQWVGVSNDIHEQRLAETALRRTEKLAAAARLAASLAHEINNPLESIVNSLFLALMDKSLNPTTRAYLQVADKELERVSQVTRQTLRFHKQSIAPAQADLAEIMDSVIPVFASRLESSEIVLKREYRTRQKLYCYSEDLRQIFSHLLSNSFDAMNQGGRLRIRIRQSRSWAYGSVGGIRVIIADTGIGIPADLRPRVFEAFVSTKDPTGTGLGLWVVDGIVQKHNGRIALRSRTGSPSSGTVISLFFPLVGAS